MNTYIQIIRLIYEKSKELYLTGNEILMAQHVLFRNTDFHEQPGYPTHATYYLLNNFHALVKEKFPNEYKSIFS
jgi:hypothetical protein